MIVCTGPISSGTRLMAGIVEGWGFEVEHRSMPHWDRFWDWREFGDAQFVIIIRRPDISVRSADKQGHGNPAFRGWEHFDHRLTQRELDQWWWRAIDTLAEFPNAWWLSYEALVAQPKAQLDSLARWLGLVEAPPFKPIYDGNEKWR